MESTFDLEDETSWDNPDIETITTHDEDYSPDEDENDAWEKSCWIFPLFTFPRHLQPTFVVPVSVDGRSTPDPLSKTTEALSPSTPATVAEECSDSSDEHSPTMGGSPRRESFRSALEKGKASEAQGLLNVALKSYQRGLQESSDTREIARLQYHIGVVQWKQGFYDGSLEFLQESLRNHKSCQHYDAEDLAQVFWAIGKVHSSRGERRKAKIAFKQAFILVMDENCGEGDEVSDRTQMLYVQILLAYGDTVRNPSRNLELLHDALAIQKEVLGDMHVDLAATFLRFGSVYEKLSDSSRAASCYWDAFRVYRSAGTAYAVDLGVTLASIGRIYRQEGELDSALRAYRDALELVASLGENHRNVASIRIQMGMVYSQQSEFSLALRQYRLALNAQRHIFGDEHKELAVTLCLIGTALSHQGRLEKAVSSLTRALDIRRKVLGPAHLHVATTLSLLADLYHSLGNTTTACQYWQEAIDLYHANQLHPSTPCLLYARKAVEATTKLP